MSHDARERPRLVRTAALVTAGSKAGAERGRVTVDIGRRHFPLYALCRLRGLERRRGMAGSDRVHHRQGGHDDRANRVAGVVALIAEERSRPAGTRLQPRDLDA
jgi:hypothetical protein